MDAIVIGAGPNAGDGRVGLLVNEVEATGEVMEVNGGTSQIHQQLVLRPLPGSLRATTAIKRLYLASASAHPGGGVHGACGANAAHAALKERERKVFLAAAVPTAVAATSLRRRGRR